jgi:hypothetical protein
MSKIYLAARFGRRFELRGYRSDLEAAPKGQPITPEYIRAMRSKWETQYLH